MSYKGNNILGDKNIKKNLKILKILIPDLKNTIIKLNRQFLHAKVIGFTHPKTGKKLEFSSKLPEDLDFLLKKLRNIIK